MFLSIPPDWGQIIQEMRVKSEFWLCSHGTLSSGVVDSRHDYLSVFYNCRNQFREGKQFVHSNHLGYSGFEALKQIDPKACALSMIT